MNLMMLLEMAASGFGERVAVQNAEASLSYSELFHAAGRAAQRVQSTGATRLAVLDVSSLAVPIGLFASAWAGVPFVPLNYRLTGTELERLLAEISPAVLITDSDRSATLSHLSGLTVLSREEFISESNADGPDPSGEWPMDPDEIAILLYTSGTTGAPKAAVLRHKHLVSYILGSVEFMSADEQAAALVCVPPYHIAGMAAIASSVYSGRRIVQLANFTPNAWLDLARKERITNAFVVPTMLARIVDALDEDDTSDLPELRAISYGGGKMPLALIERALTLFPDTNFTNAYGLTETSSTVTVLGPDDHRTAAASDDPQVQRRLVSVGKALPTIEIEIRDENGKALGPDESGEIYVRGEQVSGEYLSKGSMLESGGWFPTRDGGSLDADGYLFLEGRVDDVIVRGGENLSPGEIEDVLLTHESVADAAVVGVPNERWGEAVVAVIVLRAGRKAVDNELELELQGWVKDRLRSSRTPQRIEFVSELPYNETGKLLRRVVRAQLVEAN
ncbi:MAG: class I adenylate-forming enzyme family protein [Myxococcota bacterium]